MIHPQEAGKNNQEEKWNKIYSTEEWAKLKWELGAIFTKWIEVDGGGNIEGNPAIHRMAQYAFEYAQQREQPAPPSGQGQGMRWRKIENDKPVEGARCIWVDNEEFFAVFPYVSKDLNSILKDYTYWAYVPFPSESSPTPESQWPTEEAIRQAAWSHGESVQGDSYEKYTADCAFKEGIQWLKTQSTDREKELRECLGECIELCDSLVKSIGYECVETTEIKSLVTRAKSLLNQ